MNKFTSGPWDFEHNGAGDDKTACIGVNFAGGGKYRGEIAYIQSSAHIFGISMAEAEANARLISAAPDLLEALEGMVSIYAVSTGVNSMACKIEQELTLMARAAIARARGEI